MMLTAPQIAVLVVGLLAVLGVCSLAALASFAIEAANRRADEREGSTYATAGRTPHSNQTDGA